MICVSEAMHVFVTISELDWTIALLALDSMELLSKITIFEEIYTGDLNAK